MDAKGPVALISGVGVSARRLENNGRQKLPDHGRWQTDERLSTVTNVVKVERL